MEHNPYSQIEKGTFLVATPDLDTGLFFRSIILVCEHNPSGSFGLVLNKPLEVELPEDIINIDRMANPHVGIRAGGPCADKPDDAFTLLQYIQEIQTLKICDGVYLGGDLQFLQETISIENGPHIYLCFGYAGWGQGQLEREFLDGEWLLHPASSELIFNTPPEKLWQTTLRSMGGKWATLSMIPEDLSLN